MKSPLYLLSLFLGGVLVVHLAMNGQVGSVMKNTRVANAVFWCIGALTAVVIGLTGWQSGALAALKQVNPILLTGGAMGACLVFAIAWLMPQVGARECHDHVAGGPDHRRHGAVSFRLVGFTSTVDYHDENSRSCDHDRGGHPDDSGAWQARLAPTRRWPIECGRCAA